MRLVLPCLLLTGLTAGCGRADTPAAAPASSPPEARTSVDITDERARAAGIESAPVRAVERTEPLRAAGVVTFDERRTQRLGSLVEGVVGEIRVQPGDRVAAGTIVARLHSHVVHDAWAAYFKANAELRRVEAELAYAKTLESRAAQLVAAKALSPQELERARADVTAATEAVTGARAEILRTEQDLEHYGITARPDANARDNEDVPVIATIGGTVIERLATPGTAVTPGTPLLLISDLSRVWVTAEIDEAMLGRVIAGREATITAPARSC
jgi:membrane fusion protein, heavy metal efflux system